VRSAAALIAVVVLAGCGGGHKPTARDKVVDYIARVNMAEQQMRGPVGTAQQAVLEFSQGKYGAATVQRLGHAQATLERLRRRLRASDPPPEAAKLGRLLVQMVGEEASLAGELHQLTLFDPKFAAALRPLPAANARSRKQLQGLKNPVDVAAVIAEYRRSVERSRAALAKLSPPALEKPLYDAQVARLAALDTSLRQLEKALAEKDPKAVAEAEHAVSVASVSSDSAANQRAQRAAVQAYDASVRRLRSLARAVALERNRLQTTLK
jgi:hypothetical protein